MSISPQQRGENALKVIERVKQKLRDIAPSLPSGVETMPGYDRAGLIRDSISTPKRDLLEEAVIVSLVVMIFLLHFRSALIAILTLPIAVLISFIPMNKPCKEFTKQLTIAGQKLERLHRVEIFNFILLLVWF